MAKRKKKKQLGTEDLVRTKCPDCDWYYLSKAADVPADKKCWFCAHGIKVGTRPKQET